MNTTIQNAKRKTEACQPLTDKEKRAMIAHYSANPGTVRTPDPSALQVCHRHGREYALPEDCPECIREILGLTEAARRSANSKFLATLSADIAQSEQQKIVNEALLPAAIEADKQAQFQRQLRSRRMVGWSVILLLGVGLLVVLGVLMAWNNKVLDHITGGR